MPSFTDRLPSVRTVQPDSLLARTFLLTAGLLVLSVLASFQIYRIYEREPRSRELAQQTVSVINLTRAALVNAAPDLRRKLLFELNDREGIRVYPALADEKLDPLPADPLFGMVAERVRRELGDDTRFAFARDGEDGFWVSFFIDSDEFWVAMPRERFEPVFGLGWLGWALGLLALALGGAWLIASRIARPLAALTHAARRIGRGETPEPLVEEGPRELRTVAAAFNRMANDLASLERERAMVLAGISHDLRTPLSRMRLELEMSGADPSAARSMEADIEDIDAIIGQFLDYARGENEQRVEQDLAALAAEVAEHYRKRGRDVHLESADAAPFPFAHMALRRALSNLIENALRYAGDPVEVRLHPRSAGMAIEVLDRGPGIPPGEAARLKLPFTRLEAARSGKSGSGLGLAIVERIARMHGGTLELLPREGGGLCARLTLGRR